jgi:hypothetical protein
MILTELKRRAAWLIAAVVLMGAFGAFFIARSNPIQSNNAHPDHRTLLAEDHPPGGGGGN